MTAVSAEAGEVAAESGEVAAEAVEGGLLDQTALIELMH